MRTALGSVADRLAKYLSGFALALILVGLAGPVQVQAATCTTVAGGNWSTDANWDCGSAGNAGTDGVPGSGDTAEIGHSIIVASNVTVGTVNVNSGGFLDPTSPSSEVVATLTVESDFSINDSGSTLNAVRSVGGSQSELGLDVGGSITNDGTINYTGASSAAVAAQGSLTNNSSGSITTGPIRVDIRSSVTNDGTLTVSNNGTLEIGGNFANDGDFDATSPSLVDFAGELVAASIIADQSLTGNFFGDDAFHNVNVGTDAVVDPADVLNEADANNNPIEMDGNLSVSSGGVYGEGDAQAQTVSEGSDLTYNGDTFSVEGDLFANIVSFAAGSGTTTVSGAVFAEVRVINNSTVAVGASNFAVVGLVSIRSGSTLDVSSTALNLLGDLQVNGDLNASSGTVSFRGKGRETCCSGSSFPTDPSNRTSNNVQEVIGTANIGFGTLRIEDLNSDDSPDSGDTPNTEVEFVSSASDILVEGGFTIDEAITSTARPFTLQADFTVQNNGDFQFTEDRLLTFSAGSNQTFSTSNTSTLQVPRVRVNKTSGAVNLNAPIVVRNLLDMVDGTLAPGGNLQIWDELVLAGGAIDVTQNGGIVTLVSGNVSDPDGAGSINVDAFVRYVDDNENSGSGNGTVDGGVTGNLTFQRQLDGVENWYYMAAPAGSGTNDTFDAFLQQGGENDLRTRGVTGADDKQSDPRYASVRLYDESELGPTDPSNGVDEGWEAIDCGDCDATGLSSQMQSGKGYAVYVYDNGVGFPKTIDSDVNPYTSTSFVYSQSDGTASDGPGIDATDNWDDGSNSDGSDGSIGPEEGWNLLANPYFATIDFCAMTRGGGIDATVEVWDPQNDGYAYHTCGTGSGGAGGGLSNGYIAPHQSFFVKANSQSNLNLSIDDITSVQTNSTGFFQKQNQKAKKAPAVSFRLDLGGDQYTTSVGFRKEGSAGKDRYDAYYFDGAKEKSGLSFYSLLDNGTSTVINSLPRSISEKTTVPFVIDGCDYGTELSGQAEIEATILRNIPDSWGLVLKDTKENKMVDLSSQRTYTFNYSGSCPKSKAKSTGADSRKGLPSPSVIKHPVPKSGTPNTRFQLIVKPNAALPVEFTDISGQVEEQDAIIEWSTASETNNTGFYVQKRRGDGSTFQTLEDAFVESKADGGTTDQPQSYSYRIEDLDAGTYTFRLKQVDTDGAASYSDPIEVDVGLAGPYSFAAYPNPVQQQATVEVAVKKKADVTITLYNTLGQKVKTLYRGRMPAEQTKRLALDADNLSSGLYFVRMQGSGFTATKRITVVR